MATAAPGRLGYFEFPLWGGKAVVVVSEGAGLDAALSRVRQTVTAFDYACSSFRDDSELALLNRSHGKQITVGALLFSAVRQAVRAARRTNGLVDPTVGAALVALHVNPQLDDKPVRITPAPGWRSVELDDAARTVSIPDGTLLDLGATGKALAADLAAKAAARAAGCGVLVNLCGDIAAAGAAPDDGWEIHVTDDYQQREGPGQTVRIDSGGLATSHVTVSRSGTGASVVHHELDPSTGLPAMGPWRTVSVCADSCLDANTASTAAMVLGDRAPSWLQERRLPTRLVTHEGAAIHLANWPDDGDEL